MLYSIYQMIGENFMWYLVICIIVLLFISTSNQKTEKTGKVGQIEKAEPYERRLALNKAELEENIRNKEKYENILLHLRGKMAIKELSEEEVERIDNKISYAKECIDFFETKIILIQDKIDNSLRKEIKEKEERNPLYQKLSSSKKYKKIEERHKELVNYYQQKVSPEKEKIIKLYQQILENE